MPKETLRGPDGIKLILDSSEIYPDDPGQGTPAMVEKGTSSATFWCASEQGVLMDTQYHDVELSRAACSWLDSKVDYVNAFLDKHSPK
jgi:hypothetical protein